MPPNACSGVERVRICCATAATHLRRNSGDLRSVQELLGKNLPPPKFTPTSTISILGTRIRRQTPARRKQTQNRKRPAQNPPPGGFITHSFVQRQPPAVQSVLLGGALVQNFRASLYNPRQLRRSGISQLPQKRLHRQTRLPCSQFHWVPRTPTCFSTRLTKTRLIGLPKRYFRTKFGVVEVNFSRRLVNMGRANPFGPVAPGVVPDLHDLVQKTLSSRADCSTRLDNAGQSRPPHE